MIFKIVSRRDDKYWLGVHQISEDALSQLMEKLPGTRVFNDPPKDALEGGGLPFSKQIGVIKSCEQCEDGLFASIDRLPNPSVDRTVERPGVALMGELKEETIARVDSFDYISVVPHEVGE